MKNIFIVITTIMGAACCAPTATMYGQPGGFSFGRLEVFGPALRSHGAALPNPLVDSLVAYYGLEEASGTRYDGHGNNHLTAYNNPGDTVGVVGRAAKFDNVLGQYLQTTSPNMAVMQGDWSIMFWAKVGNVGGTDARFILGRGTSFACNSMEYAVVVQSGSMIFRVCDSSIRQYVSPATTTWNFYALRYDESIDTLYISQNGSTVGKVAVPYDIISNSPATVGATGIATYPFYGIIDEIFYWRGYLVPDVFIGWYYNMGNGRSYQEVISY